MARKHEEEGFEYRSPVTPSLARAGTSTDEGNYDTLKIVQNLFAEGVMGLYKDFNLLAVPMQGGNEQAQQEFMRQVAAKQGAYDILAPLLEQVNSAISKVDEKFKNRQG